MVEGEELNNLNRCVARTMVFPGLNTTILNKILRTFSKQYDPQEQIMNLSKFSQMLQYLFYKISQLNQTDNLAKQPKKQVIYVDDFYTDKKKNRDYYGAMLYLVAGLLKHILKFNIINFETGSKWKAKKITNCPER